MRRLVFLFMLAAAMPLQAADFQQGLRLKADNKLEAAATEFEGVLRQTPGDAKALEQLAIVQGWLGRYPNSIASWQGLLALEPRRDDARIGIARIQYWSKQWPAAINTLDDVLTRQPRSAEALTLKGDILLAQQMPEAARNAYQSALESGGDSSELQKKISRAVVPKRWRFDIGLGFDRYDNPRGRESSGFTQLGYAVSSTLNVYGRQELARQFGTNDSSLFAGAYWLVAPELLLFGETGYTPDANFRPESQFTAGMELLAGSYVQPLLTYRHANYAGTSAAILPGAVSGSGSVKTITPGVRLIFPGSGNLELRYAITANLDGSTTKVSQARLNLDAGDRWTPYLAYFSGNEALPPQAPAAFKVYVLGSTYLLNDSWSLRADLSYEDRPSFYTRKSLAVGLSYRF